MADLKGMQQHYGEAEHWWDNGIYAVHHNARGLGAYLEGLGGLKLPDYGKRVEAGGSTGYCLLPTASCLSL